MKTDYDYAKEEAAKKGFDLIPGTQLNEEQIKMLPFNGATKQSFIECNSFFFKDGAPAAKDSGFFYPYCTSLKNLPY